MYMEIVYVHCNCGELLVVLLKIVLIIFLFSFDFAAATGGQWSLYTRVKGPMGMPPRFSTSPQGSPLWRR
jgi:hypothetical protein